MLSIKVFTKVNYDLFTFVNMREKLFDSILSNYDTLRNTSLRGRYITYQHIEPELRELVPFCEVQEIGRSVLNTPIHIISLGEGPIKILAWSQMHGNESTTTKAIFDLLKLLMRGTEYPEAQSILKSCSIRIIPMLNPDGAERYTRENVNSVDLNRDAFQLEEKESKVLRKYLEEFQPDFCLNLHDQRTIFSAGDTDKPATLSFLAPAMDAERSINESRKRSMQIIGVMNAVLQNYLPKQIGRYDDAFNINCTGDSFQALGIPTILFEAGHYPNDYQREETRKYMTLAILIALSTISSSDFNGIPQDSYTAIPENRKNFFDVILRNAKVRGEIVDVAIQFKEKVRLGGVVFEPVVEIIDSSLSFYGHKEIECDFKNVCHTDERELAENDLVGAILLNRNVISIKTE